MSTSMGRIVMNTRERGVSNDITRLQDLLGQDIGDALRGLAGLHTNPNVVAAQDRHAVLRGLAAVPGGVGLTVDVQEGHAMILRAAGAPSVDDSAYRLCHNRAAQTLTLAAAHPINPRYDLIEATFADDLTETQNRDIYDPVTGLFAPAAVPKVRRAGCTLSVQTGAAAAAPVVPPFSAAATDRIPIAIIYVPALAASITGADITDVRPLWTPAPFNKMHGIVDGLTLEASSLTVDSSTFKVRPGTAIVDGQVLRVIATQPIDFSDYLAGGDSVAAGDWCFVYLFACRDGIGCRPTFDSNGWTGFVVVSKTAPNDLGYPGAAINFPTTADPLAGMFAGDASARGLYLGAIKAGASGAVVAPFMRAGDWIFQADAGAATGVLGAVPSTEIIDLGAVSDLLPSNCRMVQLNFRAIFNNGAGQQAHYFFVRTRGGTSEWAKKYFYPQASVEDYASAGGVNIALGAAQQFDLYVSNISGGAPDRWVGGSIYCYVHGIHDPVPRR